MKRISVTIDSALYYWLEQVLRLQGRTKAAIVRDSLIAYRNEIRSNSVVARAKELVGKYASGLEDISTNKKYMKGFGRRKRSVS